MTLSPELQKYYEEALATLKSPGWRFITEDLQQLRASCNDVRSCANLDHAKGQVDILDHVLGLAKMFEETYEELQRAPEPDEAPTDV